MRRLLIAPVAALPADHAGLRTDVVWYGSYPRIPHLNCDLCRTHLRDHLWQVADDATLPWTIHACEVA